MALKARGGLYTYAQSPEKLSAFFPLGMPYLPPTDECTTAIHIHSLDVYLKFIMHEVAPKAFAISGYAISGYLPYMALWLYLVRNPSLLHPSLLPQNSLLLHPE